MDSILNCTYIIWGFGGPLSLSQHSQLGALVSKLNFLSALLARSNVGALGAHPESASSSTTTRKRYVCGRVAVNPGITRSQLTLPCGVQALLPFHVWDISAPLAEVIYLIRGTLRISPFWVLPTHSPVPLLLTIYTQVGCIPIQGLIAIPSDSAVGKSND